LADDLQGTLANWAKSLGVKRFISWTIKSFTAKELRISLRQPPKEGAGGTWTRRD